MKKFLLLCLVFLIMPFSGCKKNPEFPVVTGRQPTPSVTDAPSAPSGTAIPQEVTETSEILKAYLEKYNTDIFWQDACVTFNYLLLGDNTLIYLTAIPGAVVSETLPVDYISGIEDIAFGDYRKITIRSLGSDGSLSIILSANSADELLSYLN